MHPAASSLSAAALAFLNALTVPQRAKTCYPFAAEERSNWHFVPKERGGLAFKDMTPDQRELGRALLRSGLSATGYEKALAIMNLETILKDLEGGNPIRDPERYWVAIFGTPGGRDPWGWRVEGHHLTVNLTIVGGAAVAGAPIFFGSNPARVPSGPHKGLRVLASEEDLGRELVRSLDATQLGVAVIATVAPREIITGAARSISREAPAGIAEADLTAAQRGELDRLVEDFARRLRPEIADQELDRIAKAGKGMIHFAWAGPLEPGKGHYYRVQGPTFLIEYDNTQNDANHVHAVWREYERDFGEDLLKEHYATVQDHR